MSIKQDRGFARTPADLERKYDFGKMISDGGRATKELELHVSQLTQSLAQFTATTNAKIAELEQAIIDTKTYIDNIIIELADGLEESGEDNGNTN